MITQLEMAVVPYLRRRAARLERTPEYLEYAAERKRLEDALAGLAKPAAVLDHERHLAEAEQLLDALKVRYKAGEEIQAGRLTLSAKKTPAVSWEGFWKAVALQPAIAAALAKCDSARALLTQATAKDTAAPFVTEKLTGFDVVVNS